MVFLQTLMTIIPILIRMILLTMMPIELPHNVVCIIIIIPIVTIFSAGIEVFFSDECRRVVNEDDTDRDSELAGCDDLLEGIAELCSCQICISSGSPFERGCSAFAIFVVFIVVVVFVCILILI